MGGHDLLLRKPLPQLCPCGCRRHWHRKHLQLLCWQRPLLGSRHLGQHQLQVGTALAEVISL